MSETGDCRHCGGMRHLFGSHCPRNLHGTDDPFKTSCASCGDEIPSNAARVGDKYGNLYCDAECKSDGLETLVDEMAERQ